MNEAETKTILIDFLSSSSLRPVSKNELAGYRWYAWSVHADVGQATSIRRISHALAVVVLDDLYRAVAIGMLGEHGRFTGLTKVPFAAMSISRLSVTGHGWGHSRVHVIWAVPPSETFRFLNAFHSGQMVDWRTRHGVSLVMPRPADGTAEKRIVATALAQTEWRGPDRLVRTYPTDHSVQAQKQGSFLRFLQFRSLLTSQAA
jgi:hypothetical protein